MIYLQLFLSFLQIGMFSFGGGYAALPLIQEQVVTQHGWLSRSEFTDLITISQMTPGPIAVNSATFVGIRLAGFLGALAATFGCILPSCILVTVLSYLYLKYRKMSMLQGVLETLRPAVVSMIAAAGGTHGEPGHGLTGTTPYHAGHPDAEERPGYLYVSEVSHNLGDKAYCYGGGHYRRGHMKNALVGTTPENAKVVPVLPPDDSSIDYHFELQQNCPVSAAAVMAFRTQFFVTRSRVAVVKGLSSGKPELAGLYSALGEPVRE